MTSQWDKFKGWTPQQRALVESCEKHQALTVDEFKQLMTMGPDCQWLCLHHPDCQIPNWMSVSGPWA